MRDVLYRSHFLVRALAIAGALPLFVATSCVAVDTLESAEGERAPVEGGEPCATVSECLELGDPVAGEKAVHNTPMMDIGVPKWVANNTRLADFPNGTFETGIYWDIDSLRLRESEQKPKFNQGLTYWFAAATSPSGKTVAAPNCLTCHAAKIDGKLVMGLGTTSLDFTKGDGLVYKPSTLKEKFLDWAVEFLKADRAELDEAISPPGFSKFEDTLLTIWEFLVPEVAGVTTADNLGAAAAAHRHPRDLTWSETPLVDGTAPMVPLDVPAWWITATKMKGPNPRLLFNGLSRGPDLSRAMMAALLITTEDPEVFGFGENGKGQDFRDIAAFISTLEPPRWADYDRLPPLNQELVEQGRGIYISACSRCHGTYGDGGAYPASFTPERDINTDTYLFDVQSDPRVEYFTRWLNDSVLARPSGSDHTLATFALDTERGYMAPPLDGIWATAPYFHNGSVPDLSSLLSPGERPSCWKRARAGKVGNHELDLEKDYDACRVGLRIETCESRNAAIEAGNEREWIYDTSLPGYSNTGHGKWTVTAEEKPALLEYLKTL